MTDITQPFDTRSIGHDEFEEIKKLLPEGVGFQGVGGANAIQLDIGNYVEMNELSNVADEVTDAFSNYGIPIDEVGVQPDYRGATNQALFLVISVVNDDDWEPSGYGGIKMGGT